MFICGMVHVLWCAGTLKPGLSLYQYRRSENHRNDVKPIHSLSVDLISFD